VTSPVAFDLPPELAIDTDIARRVIGEFIRGQLRQAGFERAVLGLSGGIDSALVAYLTAEAIGADKLLSVLMPYRASSPASRRPCTKRAGFTSIRCGRSRRPIGSGSDGATPSWCWRSPSPSRCSS